MRIVVGLGNPGARYQGTRHNLGFDVVERVASRCRLSWEPGRGPFDQARGRRGGRPFLLVKPSTYMNRSGEAVRALIRRHHPEDEDLAVVLDDLDLPPGQVRIRRRGQDGGHKGLRSVLDVLGSGDLLRFRLGVGGAPGDRDPADYVLEKPSSGEEAELLDGAVEMAAEAVILWLSWAPPEELMNRFNRRSPGRRASQGPGAPPREDPEGPSGGP